MALNGTSLEITDAGGVLSADLSPLAGAVFGKATEEGLDIDGFFLSCRVLGRGVEHKIINHLADRDSGVGHASLSLRFKPSDRNEPIRRFLDEIPVTDRSEGDDGSTIYQIPGGVKIAPQGASSTSAARLRITWVRSKKIASLVTGTIKPRLVVDGVSI